MKRFLILSLAALLMAIGMTSCLDIEEEIWLNADHSGRYSLKMDMGRMLRSLYLEKEEAEALVKEKMAEDKNAEKFDSLRIRVAESTGLSNFVYEAEGTGFKLSLDFKHPADLKDIKNTAFQSFDKKDSMWGLEATGRAYVFFRKTKPETIENKKETTETGKMITKMMGSARYTGIYHFPGKVKKVDNKLGNVSRDKKTVRFEAKLSEIMKDNLSLTDFSIKFKQTKTNTNQE